MNFRYWKRYVINYIFLTLATITMLFTLLWLGWILTSLISAGISHLHFNTLFSATEPSGSNGGLANAIVGSLLMVFLATFLGTPLGILAGTFLAEFGQESKLAKTVRFLNDILLSAPSIIIGLFIYQIYVARVQHFSAIAGIFALTLIVIPIVTRTTEDMFLLVPNSLREAAAALGAPRWKIITSVILRVARTGVLTGMLLALARISGETAPLLFTALNNQFWNLNLNQPMANLPMVIYQYAMSPYVDWHNLAWAGALLITLWVLGINIAVRVIFKQQPPLH